MLTDRIEMMQYIKDHYNYDFPLKAKYKRSKNRIYFSTNFKDGEEIEFFWLCDKPSSCAKGYAYYKGDGAYTNLIHISELEAI